MGERIFNKKKYFNNIRVIAYSLVRKEKKREITSLIRYIRICKNEHRMKAQTGTFSGVRLLILRVLLFQERGNYFTDRLQGQGRTLRQLLGDLRINEDLRRYRGGVQ